MSSSIPFFPSFPELLLLTTMSCGREYPFGQNRSAVPVMSPPRLPQTPSLLALGRVWVRERALIRASMVQLVLYQHL